MEEITMFYILVLYHIWIELYISYIQCVLENSIFYIFMYKHLRYPKTLRNP